MRKSILVLVAVLVGLGATVYARRAECVFCYSGPCYNSSICNGGCVCLKRGLDVSGYCYSGSLKHQTPDDRP